LSSIKDDIKYLLREYKRALIDYINHLKPKEVIMTNTIENLKSAFAGESQANRKYLAFAKKADEEGFSQISKLFRAIAEAETIHAHNHLKALGEVKTTAENLKTAMGGENYEVDSMYPPMLAQAEAESNKQAARSFRWAMEVEKVHAVLYNQALEKLGKDTTVADYYICPVCGYTHEGPMTESCPVCGTLAQKFFQVK
jgi:rubrerythrin